MRHDPFMHLTVEHVRRMLDPSLDAEERAYEAHAYHSVHGEDQGPLLQEYWRLLREGLSPVPEPVPDAEGHDQTAEEDPWRGSRAYLATIPAAVHYWFLEQCCRHPALAADGRSELALLYRDVGNPVMRHMAVMTMLAGEAEAGGHEPRRAGSGVGAIVQGLLTHGDDEDNNADLRADALGELADILMDIGSPAADVSLHELVRLSHAVDGEVEGPLSGTGLRRVRHRIDVLGGPDTAAAQHLNDIVHRGRAAE